jgi:hypothetical protein
MNKFVSILLTAILFELMLGGGGRLTAWESLSLRMVLFAFSLATVVILVWKKKRIPFDYWFLCILFVVTLIIGLCRGIVLGANRAYWWEDIKPLMYFFILPFFGFAIGNRNTVGYISNIIKISGIILSCLFIITLILIHTSILFSVFYSAAIGTEEFFFRGELTFFYKGFVYICIAFLFFFFIGDRHKYAIMILLGAAILLSVTRGFLFAITLVFTCYYFLNASFTKSLLFGVISLLIAFFGQSAINLSSQGIDHLSIRKESSHNEKKIANSNLLGDKNYSDKGRLGQLQEVTNQISFSSIFIGHGFGNGVPSRPIHMEISYLEIFHKQGLLGLSFWAFLLWQLYQKYKLTCQDGLSNAFFYGSVFIYFQSLTNQYINNPIGLSMVLLSLVCLDQLKKTH